MTGPANVHTNSTPLTNGKVAFKLSEWNRSISKTVTPYLQLSRAGGFVGWMLIFLPTAWGLTMACLKENVPPLHLIFQTIVYLFGTAVLHGAGCTINDICDRDFDRQVERTKKRPLAAGTISLRAAIIFLIAQVAVCLLLLSFTNLPTIAYGLIGLVIVGLYPLMKRITYWPQAWLGLAMNWGMAVAWSGVRGRVEWDIVGPPLFGTFCWTIYYDTLYACQDKKDDLKAGVKSTALLFGDNIKPLLSLFATGFVGSLAWAGAVNNHGILFWVLAVCAPAGVFWHQLRRVDLDDPKSCLTVFKQNVSLGFLIWAACSVDYYANVVVV